MNKNKRKKIVVIGGGTGTYTVLTGLKKYPVDLSVVVSMMDSGGSNRVIRDEFGLLPTSDIRQCIVALASKDSHKSLRQLFTYRYRQGTGISGMTFGNLFMAALTDVYGSQDKAIEKTCEILDVQGDIIPVTFDDTHLVARYSNGRQVLGEHFIDEPEEEQGKHRIIELETVPEARANAKAIEAIRKADMVILGPGDLYTSIICNLIIEGVPEAVKEPETRVVYVMNLMTKFGETHGYTAEDHLKELEKYLGENVIDVCLINKNRKFPQVVLERYKEERATPVRDNLRKSNNIEVIRKSFVSGKVHNKEKSDKIKRSLIRHDPEKLAKAIMSTL